MLRNEGRKHFFANKCQNQLKNQTKAEKKASKLEKKTEIAMKLKEIFKEMKTKHKMQDEKTNTVLAIHIFVGDFQNPTCDT